MSDKERIGGLSVDPAVTEWQRDAALNMAALSKREAAEAQRIRVRYDVPIWLKETVEEIASENGTSASGMGAFLLAWGLMIYRQGDEELLAVLQEGMESSRSMRIKWNLRIPRQVVRICLDGTV